MKHACWNSFVHMQADWRHASWRFRLHARASSVWTIQNLHSFFLFFFWWSHAETCSWFVLLTNLTGCGYPDIECWDSSAYAQVIWINVHFHARANLFFFFFLFFAWGRLCWMLLTLRREWSKKIKSKRPKIDASEIKLDSSISRTMVSWSSSILSCYASICFFYGRGGGSYLTF